MFKTPFHIRMRERRRQLCFTQKQAAMHCGMTRPRWSDLERGHRRPNHTEFRAISRLLGIRNVFLGPPAPIKKLLDEAARQSPSRQPYFPHQDRLTHIRFCSCAKRYPWLVEALMHRIQQRKDYPLCEQLCHHVSCDSNLEPLLLLYLLSKGAKVGLRAPYLFGHSRWPIVDCSGNIEVGQRPRPCMILDSTWYFFQVSFKASSTIRVDALCWNGSWSILEINGKGHDFSNDRSRALELELPTTGMTDQQLKDLIEEHLWSKAS
jgi:transcriptional regulator with XRE-family HTH domain